MIFQGGSGPRVPPLDPHLLHIETVLLSTHNIMFWLKNKKNKFQIRIFILRPELARAEDSVDPDQLALSEAS